MGQNVGAVHEYSVPSTRYGIRVTRLKASWMMLIGKVPGNSRDTSRREIFPASTGIDWFNEPQLAKKSFLDAIEKAYKPVGFLSCNGGIHSLAFCMWRDRVTAYHLFYEFLCQGRVLVVLVLTHFEGEAVMTSTRNEPELKSFGTRPTRHICVTATQGLNKVYAQMYDESREEFMATIKLCGCFLLHPWIASITCGQ
ncbi:hypothetical protein BDN67DRAFT_981373 [Paxillus ammoniavirescens]|nr:hypothetical protein BDN67DRAFT_981373 [Paxillus ammoniavirescens]